VPFKDPRIFVIFGLFCSELLNTPVALRLPEVPVDGDSRSTGGAA
jgi:hypothetical protein